MSWRVASVFFEGFPLIHEVDHFISPKTVSWQENKGILAASKNRVLSGASQRTGFFEVPLKEQGLEMCKLEE